MGLPQDTDDVNRLDDEIEELIKVVSKCENKSTMKLYAELKGEYNVYNLQKIPVKTYNKIKDDLTIRDCRPPLTEAFLLQHSTQTGAI